MNRVTAKNIVLIGCCTFPLLFSIIVNAQIYVHADTVFDNSVRGGDGLQDSYGVVISPDNNHVYSCGGGTDDAVTAFSKDANGILTYIENYKDVTYDSLRDCRRLAISPDGNHLYVPSSTDDAITVFSRNALDGRLTYVETLGDGEVKNGNTIDGLNGVHQVVVSADNNHVYAVSYLDYAISVFSRNASTGELDFVEMQKDGQLGVDGLRGARAIAIAPDGKNVYATGTTEHEISVFTRNATTGSLIWKEIQSNSTGVGLNNVYGICVSPDNLNIYASSTGTADAVIVYSRDTSTAGEGVLTHIESHLDNATRPLNTLRHLDVSNNGNYIAALSYSDDRITLFSRDASNSGRLTYVEQYINGQFNVDGIDNGEMIAFNPDDQNIYVASSGDEAVSVFGNPIPLPIILNNFEATISKDNKVLLNWSTASEINNDYFTIERSTDGEQWKSVTIVEGAGNSSSFRNYSVTDHDPYQGESFYRLKQTDFNGAFYYSKVKTIQVETDLDVLVYPNPMHDVLNIALSNELMETVNITIGTINGMVVSSYQFTDQQQVKLDMNNLSEGIYIVQIKTSHGISSHKVVKTK